jgi:hypothetical protein
LIVEVAPFVAILLVERILLIGAMLLNEVTLIIKAMLLVAILLVERILLIEAMSLDEAILIIRGNVICWSNINI